jgi:uncharacterized membrane protein YphA (DoxX/SURF4 family)/peroxiredoxin
MSIALLGARLLLGVVFLVAAVGKLRDRAGFRRSVVAFGFPAAMADAASILIPIVEIVVAILIIRAPSAWLGAIASLVLLATFTVAIAINLARGRTPECSCFGSASSEPIGPATLVRNIVLAALALLVVMAGEGTSLSGLPSWWAAASDDERSLAMTTGLLLVAVVGMNAYASRLRRANADLVLRLPPAEEPVGLPVGTQAPSFDLVQQDAGRGSLESLRKPGVPILLIFTDALCPVCAGLWPDISQWQQEQAKKLTVAAVCSGSEQYLEAKLMFVTVTNVLIDEGSQVHDAYAMTRNPSAVIVTPDGRIDSPGVVGVPAIRDLVTQRLASP